MAPAGYCIDCHGADAGTLRQTAIWWAPPMPNSTTTRHCRFRHIGTFHAQASACGRRRG